MPSRMAFCRSTSTAEILLRRLVREIGGEQSELLVGGDDAAGAQIHDRDDPVDAEFADLVAHMAVRRKRCRMARVDAEAADRADARPAARVEILDDEGDAADAGDRIAASEPVGIVGQTNRIPGRRKAAREGSRRASQTIGRPPPSEPRSPRILAWHIAPPARLSLKGKSRENPDNSDLRDAAATLSDKSYETVKSLHIQSHLRRCIDVASGRGVQSAICAGRAASNSIIICGRVPAASSWIAACGSGTVKGWGYGEFGGQGRREVLRARRRR